MAGDVAELLAEAGPGRDAGALLLQPFTESLDQECGARLPFRETPIRRAAADIGLDGVELGDPAQDLGGDLRAAALMDLAQSPAAMAPAISQPQRRTAPAVRSGQPVVAGIAVDLEDAVEAVEEALGIFAAAPGRVEVDHAGRIGAAPAAVVPGRPSRDALLAELCEVQCWEDNSREAIATAREIASPTVRSDALADIARYLLRDGDISGAALPIATAVAAAEAIADRSRRAQALVELAGIQLEAVERRGPQ